ncbi:hypothetical protein AUEXF2481DRAFT_7187 [Aureobasidium subglaciale EXF-2481]|uniref:Uncharacterized protein n=1 Tax=Aureobasidium subglaciale (strain EXF-2481) TaxID=1043005 RepID=A0A074Z127_AURSE|nr:uncharacterized protein AUEXF2481DRAFT_7187 [Aureobasidium subglaciale EXF-2481]KEQ92821.1 hypothetical protein AUEXF2481DRAFT_7187 [Aureobasidium subglaciale EXF-2481]
MLAGYETSAREHVFRSLFKRASDSFDSEDFEESERLCRLLLNYADLSIYHQAGCHRILSLGDENFLWHAEQAVNLYEQLFYPDGEALADHLLSDVQVRKRNDILQHAYSNLAQAEQDHFEIRCDYMERYDRFKAIFGSEFTIVVVLNHRQSRYVIKWSASFRPLSLPDALALANTDFQLHSLRLVAKVRDVVHHTTYAYYALLPVLPLQTNFHTSATMSQEPASRQIDLRTPDEDFEKRADQSDNDVVDDMNDEISNHFDGTNDVIGGDHDEYPCLPRLLKFISTSSTKPPSEVVRNGISFVSPTSQRGCSMASGIKPLHPSNQRSAR